MARPVWRGPYGAAQAVAAGHRRAAVPYNAPWCAAGRRSEQIISIKYVLILYEFILDSSQEWVQSVIGQTN